MPFSSGTLTGITGEKIVKVLLPGQVSHIDKVIPKFYSQ
jgi:hypothetical protein